MRSPASARVSAWWNSRPLPRLTVEMFEDLRSGECIAVDWTAAEYFAAEPLSRSVLGLLDTEPRAFRDAVAGGVGEHVESKEMRLGTLLHLGLLEPHELARRLAPDVPRPAIADGRAAAGTPGRVAFETWRRLCDLRDRARKLMSEDAIDVPAETVMRLARMIHAAQQHLEGGVLLRAPGECEQSYVWREPASGLLVKIRVDKISRLTRSEIFGTDLQHGLSATDLKSTASDAAYQFTRSARKFGYLPQASLYTDALTAYFGEVPSWYWLVVTNEPVYRDEHGASVYQLTSDQLTRGREIYRAQLLDVLERRSTNNWTAAHRRGVHTLPL